tara:strand:- start:420 stop:1178 length:759 start_codon:yes stop_codon:yes gene_type:complete
MNKSLTIAMDEADRSTEVEVGKTEYSFQDYPAGTKRIMTTIDFAAEFTREETPVYMTDASCKGMLTIAAYKSQGLLKEWYIDYSVLPLKGLDSHEGNGEFANENWLGVHFYAQKFAQMAVELLARCEWEVISDNWGNNALRPTEQAMEQLKLIQQVDDIEFYNSLQRRRRKKIVKLKAEHARLDASHAEMLAKHGIASAEEVREYGLRIMSYNEQTGKTFAECGEMIESRMDGTQPKDLIRRAVMFARDYPQ